MPKIIKFSIFNFPTVDDYRSTKQTMIDMLKYLKSKLVVSGQQNIFEDWSDGVVEYWKNLKPSLDFFTINCSEIQSSPLIAYCFLPNTPLLHYSSFPFSIPEP